DPNALVARTLATSVLADYAADRSDVLADVLMDADQDQFTIIYPKLQDGAAEAVSAFIAEIEKKLPADAEDPAKERLAKRQANAAVALVKLNHADKVWPLLKHT